MYNLCEDLKERSLGDVEYFPRHVTVLVWTPASIMTQLNHRVMMYVYDGVEAQLREDKL